MLRQVIPHGHEEGAATSSNHCVSPEAGEKQHGTTPAPIILRSNFLPHTIRKTVISELSFLQPYQNSIHSVVLVGSTVYGAQVRGSDIDVVIITTVGGHEKICSALFGKEIEDSLNNTKDSKFEYTVLSSKQTEKLFQISSPFSYSIRHGALIQDDGYLLLLRNKRFPLLPGKKYYTTCLYENIATPYYGMLKKLHRETIKKGCSASCRRKSNGCKGLQAAPMFAKLIMRMLYVTLPSRGMIPLTKADVIAYAKNAYGPQGESIARKVVSLMREKGSSFCFDESKVLKKFAVQLFREIIGVVGMKDEVRSIIFDAARVARGEHHLIHSPAMKNCVI